MTEQVKIEQSKLELLNKRITERTEALKKINDEYKSLQEKTAEEQKRFIAKVKEVEGLGLELNIRESRIDKSLEAIKLRDEKSIERSRKVTELESIASTQISKANNIKAKEEELRIKIEKACALQDKLDKLIKSQQYATEEAKSDAMQADKKVAILDGKTQELELKINEKQEVINRYKGESLRLGIVQKTNEIETNDLALRRHEFLKDTLQNEKRGLVLDEKERSLNDIAKKLGV